MYPKIVNVCKHPSIGDNNRNINKISTHEMRVSKINVNRRQPRTLKTEHFSVESEKKKSLLINLTSLFCEACNSTTSLKHLASL